MKKNIRNIIICMVMLSILIPGVTGCGNKSENTGNSEKTAEIIESTEEAKETGTSYDFTVDYKTSEMYTKDDMDKAIDVILKEFNTWQGCTMKEIQFTDDQKCKDNLSYINTLAVDTKYEQCIVFTSVFHSPVEGGDAWEADMDYENWEWYLGRTEGGDWELLTWGY